MPLDSGYQPHIYTGPLRITATGLTDQELAFYTHAARVMLGRRGAIADAAGVDTYSAAAVTPEGITIKVMCAAGIYSANLFGKSQSTHREGQYTIHGWPVPYAGVVTGGLLVNAKLPSDSGVEGSYPQLDAFSADDLTQHRLTKIKASLVLARSRADNAATMSADQLAKLDVDIASIREDATPQKMHVLALKVPKNRPAYENPVQPLPASGKVAKVFSQYCLIKPTMYTGRMRAVVQYLMGYGDMPVYNVLAKPDGTFQPTFDGTPRPEILEYAPDQARYPDDEQARNMLGAARYGFEWTSTSGIYRTDGKRFYLIEISQSRGVVAMRLPVVPNTGELLSPAVKEHFDDIPLGYDFPRDWLTATEKDRQITQTPWQRAIAQGWVKVLLDASALAEFYALKPTYAACGWAFSFSGKRADNVGYSVPLPRPNDYPVFQHWTIELSGGDATDAVYDYEHGIHGFDNSLSSLQATVRRVSKGNAWDVSQWHKPFKVPIVDDESGVPAVVSFDMNPLGFPVSWTALPDDYAKAVKSYPVCDATVHVFYDGEELQWLRFYNPAADTSATDSTSWDDRAGEQVPQCMVLGSYTWGSAVTYKTLPKGFYSNKVDQRIKGDASSTDLRSEGRKVWESPYLGVPYSAPYPPFGYGYNDSLGDDEWYNNFQSQIHSYAGSVWTAKYHAYWVKVTGKIIAGQAFTSSAAIPLTDRECFFQCSRRVTTTEQVVDYQYTASVMNLVYYTGAKNIYDPYGYGSGTNEWWELRSDTVKRTQYRYFDVNNDYTKETEQTISSVLNIQSGDYTVPTADYNRNKAAAAANTYEVVTVASRGGYALNMTAQDNDYQVWEWKLPSTDGSSRCAFLWATRNTFETPAGKMHLRLDGAMAYYGLNKAALSADQQTGPRQQATFIGEV